MWTTQFANILLIISIPSSITSYSDPVMKMSIDYLLHIDLKFVCLLYCEDNKWIQKFAKNAFASSIAVSRPTPANRSIKMDLGKCLRHKFTPIGILINVKCDNFEDILDFASQNGYFDASHKWFIIENKRDSPADDIVSDNNENFDNVTRSNETDTNEGVTMYTARFLDKLNISVDSDITVAKEKGFYYDLYEAFNFGKVQGGSLVVHKMGTWNLKEGLLVNFNTYKYCRRWDFQRLTMRQVVVITKQPKKFNPEMITRFPLSPGIPHIAHASSILVNEIADMHNFRFNYTITDRYLGDFNLNSSKVAASSLHFRTQDITSVLRFIPESSERVDFAHPPITSIEVRYFYRIPTYGPGKFENKFLTPLSTEVWGYVTLLMLLCMGVLMLAAKLEQHPSLIQYAVFSVTAFFCQQFFEDNTDNTDNQIRKKLIGCRLSLLVTGVSSVLIFNYYTSSVVSWLLNGPPPSINSLEELLESPLELIFEDVGYARSWLQTPDYYFNKRNAKVENEMRKKIFSRKKKDTLLLSLEDGIKMMQSGGYAFHTDVNSANQLISRSFTQTELCELGSLQSMEVTPLYVALQKHSPYKEFFVWSLARLSERGIISSVQRRTGSPLVTCAGRSPRALALGGAAPAFILLAGGFTLATVILFLERLCKKIKERKVYFSHHRNFLSEITLNK